MTSSGLILVLALVGRWGRRAGIIAVVLLADLERREIERRLSDSLLLAGLSTSGVHVLVLLGRRARCSGTCDFLSLTLVLVLLRLIVISSVQLGKAGG